MDILTTVMVNNIRKTAFQVQLKTLRIVATVSREAIYLVSRIWWAELHTIVLIQRVAGGIESGVNKKLIAPFKDD